MAALLADGSLENVVLLAPAIDNFERNFEHDSPSTWYMPADYVTDLNTHPARPSIKNATIIHGTRDNDDGGGDLRRIHRWMRELTDAKSSRGADAFVVLHTPDADHTLVEWLDAAPGGKHPTLSEVLFGSSR